MPLVSSLLVLMLHMIFFPVAGTRHWPAVQS